MSKNISFFLIPKSEVYYLSIEDSVGNALQSVHECGYQTVPIIDTEGRYVGTVSEGDFLWNLIENFQMGIGTMRTASMSEIRRRRDYKPVSVNATINELDKYIMDQNFVPVIDGRGVFIGIITRKEIFKSIIADRED